MNYFSRTLEAVEAVCVRGAEPCGFVLKTADRCVLRWSGVVAREGWPCFGRPVVSIRLHVHQVTYSSSCGLIKLVCPSSYMFIKLYVNRAGMSIKLLIRPHVQLSAAFIVVMMRFEEKQQKNLDGLRWFKRMI